MADLPERPVGARPGLVSALALAAPSQEDTGHIRGELASADRVFGPPLRQVEASDRLRASAGAFSPSAMPKRSGVRPRDLQAVACRSVGEHRHGGRSRVAGAVSFDCRSLAGAGFFCGLACCEGSSRCRTGHGSDRRSRTRHHATSHGARDGRGPGCAHVAVAPCAGSWVVDWHARDRGCDFQN